MPLGGKAIKRREQAADAKNGIIRDELTLRKMANAKKDVLCCGVEPSARGDAAGRDRLAALRELCVSHDRTENVGATALHRCAARSAEALLN